ncbi:MAG: HAD family hydrolase, partial [Bacteroidales bacterium]
MELAGIKNIVFDLGGVLINLNRQRCIDAYKALGYADA